MNKYRVLEVLFFCLFFISCNVFAGSHLKQVEDLIEKYGKKEIIDFILKKDPDNKVTVHIGKKLYVKSGIPSTQYISIHSINHDLKRLRLTPHDADVLIRKLINRKKKAAEKKRMEEDERQKQLYSKFDKGPHSFRGTVSDFFVSSLIQRVEFKNGTGEIVFTKNNGYFGTGDRANIVFAIDSARLFRDVIELEQLKLTIPVFTEIHTLDIRRRTIEKHYNTDLSRLKNDLTTWKTQFLKKHDTKQSRAAFANKFVRILSK